MKKICFTFSLLLFFSCGQKNTEANNAVENANSTTSYTRFSKGQNILDAIYNEQIKNDENLKKLDDKIKALYEDKEKVTNINQEIMNKSSEYYSDVESIANNITDSLLKKQILELIKISADKNYLKEKKFIELSLEINKNNQMIHSHYSAFKIRKTLPEIEKYQNAHPLKTDSLEKFIEKQNKLLIELKNLK